MERRCVRRVLLALLACCVPFACLAAEPQSLTRLPAGVSAPDFSLEEYDDPTVRRTLADYRGKVLVVNFWATWCPPCREELPSMNRAWRRLKESGVVMLAVNVGENEDVIFPFLAEYPVEFPILLDRSGAVTGAWPVRGIPTTFVLDREGRFVYRAIGGRAWDSEELIERIRGIGAGKP